MPRTATTLSSWVRAIRKTLDAADCDGEALLREAGIDPGLLDDPNARYPLDQTTRLWAIARRETGDDAIGLRVAGQVTQTTFHALGYTLPASATLREAFERIVRYFRIVTNAADLAFARAGNVYHVDIVPLADGPQPAPEAIDAFVSIYVRMCRAFAGSEVAPLHIALRRPPPANRAAFDRTLRAPLSFGAAHNRLTYDRATLERPLEGANPELASHHEQIAQHYLARFERDDLRARLEVVLTEQLPHGEPSQLAAAHALQMSPRSLQRRLAALATSYSAVLDDTRRALALRYLRDRGLSISETTYLLGFADTSSLTRACKRWTGEAPSALRAKRT